MDTSKLITVTIWATLALIAYEVYVKVVNPTASGNLVGGVPFNSLIPADQQAASGNFIPPALSAGEQNFVNGLLETSDGTGISPGLFTSGAESSLLGEFGF